MVQIRQHHFLLAPGEIDVSQWVHDVLDRVGWDDIDQAQLLLAGNMAKDADVRTGRTRWATGISSFKTGLEMAEILVNLHLHDEDSLVAALLYRVVRERRLPISEVRKHFGDAVAGLITGVQKMAVINSIYREADEDAFGLAPKEQAGKVREMLVSIVDDVRVALIKLSERACAIRALKNATEEKKQRVAREVVEIYTPLAHRLGVGQLKWELEDLAFRYQYPTEYKRIATLLDERRLDRQRYIEDVTRMLEQAVGASGIDAEVTGRVKHIYSIWRKMIRKGVDFDQIYDIRAVRILVNTVADCYAVLGVVHGSWPVIAHEFDDYIAVPKENGYRSLHTAVIGPGQKVLEVQIRTYDMQEEAEFGVCSHWQYKGVSHRAGSDRYNEKLAWLRQVLEWHEELEGAGVKELISCDSAIDRVYVFTPEGHVVDLPVGSTPLDFAYRVHTSIGHRCRGAKVNGRMVPLNYVLQTTDQIHILTNKDESPDRHWLVESLGYLHTSRARARVQSWFRRRPVEINISEGKEIVDKAIAKLNMKAVSFHAVLTSLEMESLNQLYAAVGVGDIHVKDIIHALEDVRPDDNKEQRQQQHASRYKDTDAFIYGTGGAEVGVASCCDPAPRDEISGYIGEKSNVLIHRMDCEKLLELQVKDPSKVLEVRWGAAPKYVFPATIRITVYDRGGLLRDVSNQLGDLGLNILSFTSHRLETESDGPNSMVNMDFTVEAVSAEELSRVMAKVEQIANVIHVELLDDEHQ